MIDNSVFVNSILSEINNLVSDDTLKEIHRRLNMFVDDYTIEQKHFSVAIRDSRPKAYKDFLVSKKIEGLSDITLKSYKEHLEKFFDTVTYPLEQITTQTVQIFLYNYSNTSHGASDKKPSAHTMNQYQSILNSFFSWCANNGYIAKNPCKNLAKIKFQKKEIDVLSEEQLQNMLKQCSIVFKSEDEQKRAYAIIQTFISTGIRVSELVNLKIRDIQFDTPMHDTFPVYIESGKGNKDRTVFLTEDAAIAILDYMNYRYSDSEYLFVRTINGNGQLTTRTVQNIVSTLGNAIGVESCHCHQLRHTVATEMAKKGTSINLVQKMLGHTTTNTTTKYYVKAEDEQLAKEVGEKLC